MTRSILASIGDNASGMCFEAADEIERLRAELDAVKAERDERWSEGNYYRAEIERLRGMLDEYAVHLNPEDIGLVKVNNAEHLNWPWYRYPGVEFEHDPQVHGVREIPEPIKEQS